jgi:hypothetical protein
VTGFPGVAVRGFPNPIEGLASDEWTTAFEASVKRAAAIAVLAAY